MAKKSSTDFTNDTIVYTAEIPMPSAFKESVKDLVKSAQVDAEQRTALVGDNVTGYVHAEKNGMLGKWTARGEGDLDYERRFGRMEKIDVVVREVAEDLAALNLTVQEVATHIMKHNLKKSELLVAEIGETGEEMDFGNHEPG